MLYTCGVSVSGVLAGFDFISSLCQLLEGFQSKIKVGQPLPSPKPILILKYETGPVIRC